MVYAAFHFERKNQPQIGYKGFTLKKEYMADFSCFDQIIVELKSVTQLSPIDLSQILNFFEG